MLKEAMSQGRKHVTGPQRTPWVVSSDITPLGEFLGLGLQAAVRGLGFMPEASFMPGSPKPLVPFLLRTPSVRISPSSP